LNKRTNYLLFLLIVVGLLGLGYLFLSAYLTSQSTNVKVVAKEQAVLAPAVIGTKNVVQNVPQQELEERFLSEDLISQINSFTDVYEESSRYPVFSIPVTDPESVDIAEPFEESEVETPQFDEDGTLLPLSIKAAVDKFEYFIGEPITVRLQVLGLEENQSIYANANIKKPGASALAPTPVEFTPLDEDKSTLMATFETNSFKAGRELGDLIAAVSVNVDGDEFFTSVPLRINQRASARLENVGVAKVDGAFLKIPLQFSVGQSGYFFVQAYLFDSESNRPLLSLQTEGSMGHGNDELILKAHYHALKDAGSHGPYILKVHRTFRSAKPELQEMIDVPVAISSPAFFVQGFGFEHYLDQAYTDPETQRRIRVLRELSASTESL